MASCDGCTAATQGSGNDHYLSDILLKQIAELLGNEWSTLGLYLDVSSSTINNLRASITIDVKMWPKAMLEKWVQRHSGDRYQLYDALLAALAKVYRRDLVEDIRQIYPRGSVLTSNDCNETHKLFDYLASRLATKWRDLGIYLHVPSHELDKIEAQYSQPASNKSPALELLFAWRSQTRVETEYQRIATLQDALRKIHRNDIVGLIDREVRKNLDLCQNPEFLSLYLDHNPGQHHHQNNQHSVPYDSTGFASTDYNRRLLHQPSSTPGPQMDYADNQSLGRTMQSPSGQYISSQPMLVNVSSLGGQAPFPQGVGHRMPVHPTAVTPEVRHTMPVHPVSRQPSSAPPTALQGMGGESLQIGGHGPSIPPEQFVNMQQGIQSLHLSEMTPSIDMSTDFISVGVQDMHIDGNTMSTDLTQDPRNGPLSLQGSAQ